MQDSRIVSDCLIKTPASNFIADVYNITSKFQIPDSVSSVKDFFVVVVEAPLVYWRKKKTSEVVKLTSPFTHLVPFLQLYK